MDDAQAQLIIRNLGQQPYGEVFQKMKDFTEQRNSTTNDEIWLVEHPAIYTLGRNGKKEHILNAGDIPVVQVDRGGQVTYHGIGQLVIYLLLDIRRKNLGVRQLVSLMEQSIIDFLMQENIIAESRKDAPGVYVQGEKIAALGLRVSKGCTYHGLSLNIDMDLSPFQGINPCGYEALSVTQCLDLGFKTSVKQAGEELLSKHLIPLLGYPSQYLNWIPYR